MEIRGGEEKEMGVPSSGPGFASPAQPKSDLDPLYDQLNLRRKLAVRSRDQDRVSTVGSDPEIAPPPPLPPPPTSTSAVRYRECQKNHAAALGGHVVDGCGEFMPCGEDGTPEALKCAACECHRNFHRKEIDGYTPAAHRNYNYTPGRREAVMVTPPPSSAPPPVGPGHFQNHRHSHRVVSQAAPVMMAFGGAAESSSEDLNMFRRAEGQGSGSRKRFRTKFSQEQKEKMMGFAEKVGWRIQKQDEQQVQQFCDDVGLKRQVLKVWMHNNKPTSNKRP